MKTILLFLISFAAIAQTDTTTIKENVKKIDGKFYLETVTTATTYQLITSSMFADIESREEQKARLEAEIRKGDAERAEKIKLLKRIVKAGFKPNPDDWKEVEIFDRVMKKIN